MTTKDFEEYAKFCDDESVEKDYAIKDSKEQVETLGATITDAEGGIASATAAVEDLSTKISDTESELSTASALRKQENESFKKTEGELLTTVGELTGATTALKKSLALVQLRGGRVGQQERDALAAVVAGLGQIVEASFVAPEQRRKIQALLEERADAEEQFEFRAHSLDSNAIVETLTEMEDKASESLTDARKREGEAAQAHALLKQGLESEAAGMKEELSENTNRKASLGEKLAGAQGDLAITQKSLAEELSENTNRKASLG